MSRFPYTMSFYGSMLAVPSFLALTTLLYALSAPQTYIAASKLLLAVSSIVYGALSIKEIYIRARRHSGSR